MSHHASKKQIRHHDLSLLDSFGDDALINQPVQDEQPILLPTGEGSADPAASDTDQALEEYIDGIIGIV